MEFDINKYFPDETYYAGDAGRASFAEKRPLYLAASKHFLKHYREEIKKAHRAGANGERVVEAITTMTDKMVCKLFHCITGDLAYVGKSRERLVLVAIGGYGRGELNP